MNIIKQLKDVNGNNIYPIAYAQGGMKMDLLWTNPNPSASFAAQTVSLDLSEYSCVLISVMDGTNLTTLFAPIDNKKYIANLVINNGQFRWRSFVSSVSGITVEEGKQADTTYNNIMIPYQIFGIKTSYVVPTSVHGLQYVEV